MKFPWIKKFFGGEEEETQIKEREGMKRRTFLFMMPGIVVLPEIIKDISTRDVFHITEVAKWPGDLADVGMDSLSAITMRWPEGMHVRTTEPIGAKGYLFGTEHIPGKTKILTPAEYADKLIEMAAEEPDKYRWLPDLSE